MEKTKLLQQAEREVEARAAIGRPPIEMDVNIVRRLRETHHTIEEVAAIFNVSPRTVKRRIADDPEFKAAWEAGIAYGKASLRRLQFKHAQMPNSAGVQMTIHLSKHWLGETDKTALELSGSVDGNVTVTQYDRISSKLDGIGKRLNDRVAQIAAAAGARTNPGEPVGSPAAGDVAAAGAPAGPAGAAG